MFWTINVLLDKCSLISINNALNMWGKLSLLKQVLCAKYYFNYFINGISNPQYKPVVKLLSSLQIRKLAFRGNSLTYDLITTPGSMYKKIYIIVFNFLNECSFHESRIPWNSNKWLWCHSHLVMLRQYIE